MSPRIVRAAQMAGLSSVEFGLVASLGRRPPMSNGRLLELLGRPELEVLLGQIDRLTETAAEMLATEKDLN